MQDQMDKHLMDEAFDAYVAWRDECGSVRDAYDRWAGAPVVDAAGAFSAYQAALDQEESASQDYADMLARTSAGNRSVAGFHAPAGRAFTR
jgi:hypothetical protein